MPDRRCQKRHKRRATLRFCPTYDYDWLPSADEWVRLRQIRHEFTQDYPDSPAERFERLQAATAAAKRGIVIMEHINQNIRQRFDLKQVLS